MKEGDFSKERELSVIIVTSLGIFKKTVESLKEIKRAKTKIKIERIVQTAVVFGGDVAIVCDDGCVNLVCQDSTWVADSTTFYHVIPQCDFFIFYTAGDFG
jgi:hypothetical protein